MFRRCAGSGLAGACPRPSGIAALIVALRSRRAELVLVARAEGLWVNESPAAGVRVAGFSTVDTLISVTGTLLDKPGGYLATTSCRPACGSTTFRAGSSARSCRCRDLAKVLRNDYSRSQSQSIEEIDLSEAEPLLNFDANSWILPEHRGRIPEARSGISSSTARV